MNKELRMYTCFCGAALVGTDADYSQHLEVECPVYAEAREKLAARTHTPVAGGEMK